MAVTIFSGNETPSGGLNHISRANSSFRIDYAGREGKKMETNMKMAWAWAVLLVYAIGYTIGSSFCIA
jgi:hypothetical protein